MNDDEKASLDLKEYLFTGDVSVLGSNASKYHGDLTRMQDDIMKLQHQIGQHDQINMGSNVSAYHKCTMGVGGLQDFASREDAKEYLRSKMTKLEIIASNKIESVQISWECSLVLFKMRPVEIPQ